MYINNTICFVFQRLSIMIGAFFMQKKTTTERIMHMKNRREFLERCAQHDYGNKSCESSGKKVIKRVCLKTDPLT